MAVKNTLSDLNNHLFEQLERLNDDDLTQDELEKEINRSKAMTSVAANIVNNANTMLEAAKLSTEFSRTEIPSIIGITKNE